jgi:hypothetical protein
MDISAKLRDGDAYSELLFQELRIPVDEMVGSPNDTHRGIPSATALVLRFCCTGSVEESDTNWPMARHPSSSGLSREYSGST